MILDENFEVSKSAKLIGIMVLFVFMVFESILDLY